MKKRGRQVAVVEGKVARSEKKKGAKNVRNHVRKIRESMLLSKAELARKAGLSALTIDRVESGYDCRMDTKRKIILALGIQLVDKDEVFVQTETEDED